MTDKTDHPPQPYERALDIALALLCWALTAIGIGFEAMTALPLVAHEHGPTDMRVGDLICIGGIAFLSGYALLLEWVERHHRFQRRLWRRIGLCCQAMLLTICLGDAYDKHQYKAIPFILSAVVTGTLGWAAWMRTQLLDPEAQKAIDAVIDAKAQRAAEGFRADHQRRQDARFRAAAARYGANPDASSAAPAALASAPTFFPWPVAEGKHRPLVYFISNGSRVKIGTTSNLRSRVSALSLRTSDIVLLLQGDRRTEQEMHKRFAAHRVGTTEWFEHTGPLAAFIKGHNEQALANAKARG